MSKICLSGPSYALNFTDTGSQNHQFGCLRWLIHFHIPEALPADGSPVAYSDVATSTDVPEKQLRPIARMAMLISFLAEPKPGMLGHSPTSLAFVKFPSLLTWAHFLTSTSSPMVHKMVEATERWRGSPDKNHTAYNVAWDTDLPIFAHVAESEERRGAYAAYMRDQTTSDGMALQNLANGFAWGDLSPGTTVVDVGGSGGHVSAFLAKVFPQLSFVVQDLPDTVAQTEAAILAGTSAVPADILSRVSFEGHDFFKPQIRTGVAVFLLRMILHDWPAAEAAMILRNLAAALQVGGRIIIMDTVLPRPGEGSRGAESVLRVRDLTMLQAHNAQERERGEWEELVRQAGSSLVLRNVVQPFKSVMAVLEVSYEPIGLKRSREDDGE